MKKEKKSNKYKKLKIIISVIVAALLAVLIAGYFILGSMLKEDDKILGWQNSALVDEFGNPITLKDNDSEKKSGVYNILVGSTDKGGTRTDSIMLINFDTKEKKIACMSIPRDTYIATDRASKKINACYAYGKSEEFVAKTQETFGIDIDYYVIMDIDTFKNVVDALGGVEVDVQFDMDYDDPAQNLHIHIKKGKQVLSGEQAEGFVRYRKGYAAADIARIEAQKVFLASAAKKLASQPSLITKVVTAAFEGIKTNINQVNAIKVVTSAMGMDFNNVTMLTLPGTSASKNGVSYYSMYKDETLNIINEYFNTYKDDIEPDQCAMIELKSSNGSNQTEIKTLEEISQTAPPKKTNNFSSSSPKSQTEVPDNVTEQPEVPEEEPQIDETPDTIEEEPGNQEPEGSDNGENVVPPQNENTENQNQQSGQQDPDPQITDNNTEV